MKFNLEVFSARLPNFRLCSILCTVIFLLNNPLQTSSVYATLGNNREMSSSTDRLETFEFGTLSDGTKISGFRLSNDNHMQVTVISYGAIVTEINTPDKDGNVKNVILGSDKIEDFEKGFPAAAVVGRFANRISHGKFQIDGNDYQVTVNHGPHHLHGGNKGFASVNWDVVDSGSDDSSAFVELQYVSADGEEGYPGKLVATIRYTLDNNNQLTLSYKAETDKPTIVNFTNHAYFDLSTTGAIGGHQLWINADQFTEVDKELIPTGELLKVADTPLDFTKAKTIGEDVEKLTPPFYDHNYVLNASESAGLVFAARVEEPTTGRTMEVHTDEPGMQLYTGNAKGLCLETQHFPDAINHPSFPTVIVRPDQAFESTTVFKFGTK